MSSAEDVLQFWKSIGPNGWWRKNEAVDRQIIEEFSDLYQQAVGGALADWKEEPNSALALVIVLDQFSRNMFRGDARTFAHDGMALDIARHAIELGYDAQADQELHSFFYLPLIHSETLREQEDAVALMHRIGNKPSLDAALEHREIIQRFGRFPHRNSVLGRHTTPAEQAFLDSGGFKG